MGDQLQELMAQHQREAPEISFKKWLDSKPDSYFKRMEFKSGGNVIQFPVDLTKYRTEPKIRKIMCAKSSTAKTRGWNKVCRAEHIYTVGATP